MIVVLSAFATSSEAADWRAGTARVRITPDEPMYLSGFGDRIVPAEGTAQDLFAKCLFVADDRGSRLAIVTMDLLYVPAQLRAALEAALAERLKLEPAALLMNCSHTHCGPELKFNEHEWARASAHSGKDG